MKNAVILAISVAALALAGCGKKEDPAAQATTGTEAAGTSTTDSAAALPAGQVFANTAASSDAFEIETSKLAGQKAGSAKIKTFAEHMIKAHTDSTAKLKAAAGAAAPPIMPDPTLTAMQQQKLDELKGKSGADFDKAFAAAQVEGHQMTLDTLKAYSATGDVPTLKGFATELVPIVTAHLNMAKSL